MILLLLRSHATNRTMDVIANREGQQGKTDALTDANTEDDAEDAATERLVAAEKAREANAAAMGDSTLDEVERPREINMVRLKNGEHKHALEERVNVLEKLLKKLKLFAKRCGQV